LKMPPPHSRIKERGEKTTGIQNLIHISI